MKRFIAFLLTLVILISLYVPAQAKKILEECYHCQMSGTFYCESCHNKGELTCDLCGGTGGSKCPDCDGSGYYTCPSCHGDGYARSGDGTIPIDTPPGSCGNCGGSGKLRCITCHDKPGWVYCTRCYGKGKMECQSHNCQAAKAVGWKCPYCLGTGYLGSPDENDGVTNVPHDGDDVQRLDHSWYVYGRTDSQNPDESENPPEPSEPEPSEPEQSEPEPERRYNLLIKREYGLMNYFSTAVFARPNFSGLNSQEDYEVIDKDTFLTAGGKAEVTRSWTLSVTENFRINIANYDHDINRALLVGKDGFQVELVHEGKNNFTIRNYTPLESILPDDLELVVEYYKRFKPKFLSSYKVGKTTLSLEMPARKEKYMTREIEFSVRGFDNKTMIAKAVAADGTEFELIPWKSYTDRFRFDHYVENGKELPFEFTFVIEKRTKKNSSNTSSKTSSQASSQTSSLADIPNNYHTEKYDVEFTAPVPGFETVEPTLEQKNEVVKILNSFQFGKTDSKTEQTILSIAKDNGLQTLEDGRIYPLYFDGHIELESPIRVTLKLEDGQLNGGCDFNMYHVKEDGTVELLSYADVEYHTYPSGYVEAILFNTKSFSTFFTSNLKLTIRGEAMPPDYFVDSTYMFFIGLGLTAVLLIVIIVAVVVHICKKRKKKKEAFDSDENGTEQTSDNAASEAPAAVITELNTAEALNAESASTALPEQKTTEAEAVTATDSSTEAPGTQPTVDDTDKTE